VMAALERSLAQEMPLTGAMTAEEKRPRPAADRHQGALGLRSPLTRTVVHPLDGIAERLVAGDGHQLLQDLFRAVSLGTCFRITSRTRSTVLLLAATRHLLQHPQGHRSFTLAVTGRASRAPRVGLGRRVFRTRVMSRIRHAAVVP